MSPRSTPLWAAGVLVFSVALLVIMALLAVGQGGDDRPQAVRHLGAADWQVTEAPAFSTPPSVLDSASLPPDWEPVLLPHALPIALLRQAGTNGPHGADGAIRTTWYRFRLSGLPALSATGPLALYASRAKTDGTIAVYADGRLVHRAQQQGPLWNSTRTPLWVVLDKADRTDKADRADAGRPPAEILIRLEHSRATQVALSTVWLGPADALRGRYHARQWLQQELPAMLSAAFLAVGVFGLFVWFRRPAETGYLLFFNLAATSFLRGLHFYTGFPIANDWFAWLTVNSLFWLVTVVHLFLCLLHGRPLRWLSRALVATTVLVGVATLPVLDLVTNTPLVTPLIYIVAALMGATAGLVGGVIAWRRSREGRVVAIGIVLCTLLGVSDWLLQNNFVSPESWYLGAYTNAVTFCTFGILMYRRYVDAIGEVERLNASLAQRLLAREAELEQSHRRLRAVELRQTITDERQRLMQDMHDGLGSSLISAIRSAEHGGMSPTRMSQVLKDCLDDLKLTIDSMEPVDADLLLLLATLRFRLEPRLEGSGVTLRWDVQELPALPWLDPSSALQILRIVQESIANILRHTRATEIRVGTAAAGTGVQVSIEDNGQGFDVAAALAGGTGRGLHNQRRRAVSIGGAAAWTSGPAGTRFVLRLPLQRAPAATASAIPLE